VLYLPAKGHTVVLGTAGSGKTTLAILRAVYLAEKSTPHFGGTLLLTFNNTLIAYLRHWIPTFSPHLTVETYHKFARGYLGSRGKMGWHTVSEKGFRDQLISQAIDFVRARCPDHPILDRSQKFFDEEIKWIFQQGVATEQEYVNAERIGRSLPVDRKHRGIIWMVVELYRVLRSDAGKTYDWDDMATTVLSELEQDTSPRRYKHVVIDEGQDLSPQMLRSLVRAVPEDGSVTFFGDVAQQIYGQRISWRSAGFKIVEAWKFEENYRNTRQIANLALEIAAMPYFQGGPDLIAPKRPAADGPPPTIAVCKSYAHQLQTAAEQAKAFANSRSVAILLRNRNDESTLKRLLPINSIRLHKEMANWHAGPGVFYGTYYAAKGLEFDAVIMPFCDADRLPLPGDVMALGPDEAMAQDGRLLYVGATRARSILIITHSSQLTQLLPAKPDLYQVVSV
jgi:superfamily I DNA/RNA helicase